MCKHHILLVDSFNEQGALVRCLLCNSDLELDGETLAYYLPLQFNSPRGKDHDMVVFISRSTIGGDNV